MFLVVLLVLIGLRSTPMASPLTYNQGVVAPGYIQVLMFFGDRYLASNIELIRSTAAGGESLGEDDALNVYRMRSHRVVSLMNACHEDNYWIGNSVLSWGGAVDEGFDLLRRATFCRAWDELPPFMFGFNQAFFKKDYTTTRQALELAASRSPENAVGYKKLGIMLGVNSVNDAELAKKLLEAEIARTSDEKLKNMLEMRLRRLDGLLVLRAAKVGFESKFLRSLINPNELISSGVIESFPFDPLGLGYEYINGDFVLRQVRILGLN